MFMSVLDQTSVNLALPRIADHFAATIPEVQWVVVGYILATSSLLLPMGRLSDMVGRKRVYTAGLGIFALGAVLAGSSPTLLLVVLSKVLQSVGSAMVQANGMAMVTEVFPERERGKALGLFMTVIGGAAVAGPIVGGAVVGAFGWRSVFFMALPLGMASIAVALLVLESDASAMRGRQRRPSFDWLGAGLSSLALTSFLLVMTNAYRVGWGSPLVSGTLAGVVVLLAAFVWWELRTREPVLALGLFRHRLFSYGTLASFLAFLSGTSIFFLMPFYLQEVLEFSPGQAGMVMAPTALCFALTGSVVGRLSDRFGWRRFTIGGLLLCLASILLLSRILDNPFVGVIVAAMVMQGVGMGSFYSPNASAVLSTVERPRYGVATAFLNLTRTTANVTGVALATTIVTAVMASQGYPPSLEAVASGGGEGVKAAFTQGLQTALLTMTGFLAVAILLSSVKVSVGAKQAAPATKGRVPTGAQD